MVNMNLGKRARLTASITNSTKIFGIMGGLAPLTGLDSATRSYQMRKATTKTLGNLTEQQLRERGLLSVNPQTSGGVGKKVLLFSR
jgi:hypothetical protein